MVGHILCSKNYQGGSHRLFKDDRKPGQMIARSGSDIVEGRMASSSGSTPEIKRFNGRRGRR